MTHVQSTWKSVAGKQARVYWGGGDGYVVRCYQDDAHVGAFWYAPECKQLAIDFAYDWVAPLSMASLCKSQRR